MNRNRQTMLVASLVVASALVGCGGSSSSTKTESKAAAAKQVAVSGGSATFVPDADTIAALEKQGVKLGAGSGGVKRGGSLVLVFRNGKMVKTGLIGRARSHGSLVFARGDKKVVFADVMVDTAHRRVTGVESDKRITLYTLKIKSLQRTRLKDGSFSGTGLTVRLAPDAAKRLNAGLGVKVFEPKMKFGSVAIIVKFDSSAKSGSSGK